MVVKGEKRIETITLVDNINIRPIKRPGLLGPSSGTGVGGASTSCCFFARYLIFSIARTAEWQKERLRTCSYLRRV